MKEILMILTITAVVSGLYGCDQAQKALDTVDKAISLKNDVEKKAKDVKEKAFGLIPGSGADSGGKNSGSKEEGGKGGGKEKDD